VMGAGGKEGGSAGLGVVCDENIMECLTCLNRKRKNETLNDTHTHTHARAIVRRCSFLVVVVVVIVPQNSTFMRCRRSNKI
jgi:hypothetical protein